MKNLQYSEIKKIFTDKIFGASKADLLTKISKNPERYIGIFRPTKPKTKIIQNITQSQEIKFGDAFELLIRKSFISQGYQELPLNYEHNGRNYSMDQLFSKGNEIIFIEQKLRDDHDSTKKRGQIENFENKIVLLSEKFEEKKIKAYFYFIDDSLHKNKNYYQGEIENIRNTYEIECNLCYGEELFEHEIGKKFWFDEIIEFLIKWRSELPDLPNINFDTDAEETFREIKSLQPPVYRKILQNNDIVSEIFPIIFPQNKSLILLNEHFKALGKDGKNKSKVYINLSKLIEEIIS